MDDVDRSATVTNPQDNCWCRSGRAWGECHAPLSEPRWRVANPNAPLTDAELMYLGLRKDLAASEMRSFSPIDLFHDRIAEQVGFRVFDHTFEDLGPGMSYMLSAQVFVAAEELGGTTKDVFVAELPTMKVAAQCRRCNDSSSLVTLNFGLMSALFAANLGFMTARERYLDPSERRDVFTGIWDLLTDFPVANEELWLWKALTVANTAYAPFFPGVHFLIAHELGHLALGHQPGHMTADHEHEADAFALDVMRSGRYRSSEFPTDEDLLVGISMLGLVTELFEARRGRSSSHPAARERHVRIRRSLESLSVPIVVQQAVDRFVHDMRSLSELT